jgi:zinc D-Ala-D-Ala dipeptidase
MKLVVVVLSVVVVFLCPLARSEGLATDLINLSRFDFSIKQELRYATSNNFAHRVFYPEAKCLLRRSVAQSLSRVQASLKLQGFGLKIFDCYRPLSIQKRIFVFPPDKVPAVNPEWGDGHNRAVSVDVTLLDSRGEDLEMPSRFEDFSPGSPGRHGRMTTAAKRNLNLLVRAMKKEGFVPNPDPWWHFDIKNVSSYPVEDVPFDSIQ